MIYFDDFFCFGYVYVLQYKIKMLMTATLYKTVTY